MKGNVEREDSLEVGKIAWKFEKKTWKVEEDSLES